MTTPQLILILGGIIGAALLLAAYVILEGELMLQWYERKFSHLPLLRSPRRSRTYRIVLFLITLPLLPFKPRTANLKPVRYEN